MKFRYKAQNPEKRVQTGIVEASNKEEAVKTLQSHNLIVFSLVAEEDIPVFKKKVNIPFLNRITQKDLVVFSRELATLVEGKVSLVEALKSLARQTNNVAFRDIIAQVAQDVEGGSSLSKAMGKHSKVFSDFYMNLIKSAEVSGTLEKTLIYLADYEEQRHDTVSKVKGAMMYPVLLLVFMFGIGIFAMTSIVPKITAMLVEAEVELPVMTKILIGVSNFMQHYWYLIIIGTAVFITWFWHWVHTSQGSNIIGKVLLKIPVIGKILKHFYLNRIADNLKTLLKGGISILKALEVVSGVIGNSAYRSIIIEAREEVRGGQSMSSVFETYKEFPPMFTEMVRVGERSGNVDNMLDKLAAFYKKEVDAVVDNISKLIEPFLIILLGLGVAFLVSSIIIPIYRMSQAF
jgi:type IV pilus assembly protein PilC